MSIGTFVADGSAGRYFGLYPAIVSDLVDPESVGRIEVSFPWLGEDGGDVRAWATLLTPHADDDHGLMVLPEVDTQVVVGFEAGDLRRPYIVGACWNGREALPEAAQAANNLRLWQSRAKSRLEFDDTTGAAKVSITMQSGHKVVLDDAAREITITHSNGCELKMDVAGTITIRANSRVVVQVPMVQVDAATSVFSGLVKCDTLITNSVVSPSYTPGAGNVW
jgi:uncharacterized protein involved in type VI secretion and phage assembly